MANCFNHERLGRDCERDAVWRLYLRHKHHTDDEWMFAYNLCDTCAILEEKPRNALRDRGWSYKHVLID